MFQNRPYIYRPTWCHACRPWQIGEGRPWRQRPTHVSSVGLSIAGRAREIDSKEQLPAKRRSYAEATWNPSQTRSDVAAYCGITDCHLHGLWGEFGVGFDALPPLQAAVSPVTLRNLINPGFVSPKIDRSAVARWIEELGTEPCDLSRAELRRTEELCQVSRTAGHVRDT